MKELVFVFDKSAKDSLASVRFMDELLVGVDDQYIWLRGIDEMSENLIIVKQLQPKHSYTIDNDNMLFVPGKLTPMATLPTLEWIGISEFIPIDFPVSAVAGQLEKLAEIKLKKGGQTMQGDALLLPLDIWKVYAETAPAVRLASLLFAVSEDNEVLVVGNPLPPLPGKEYWLSKNILLPNGYHFDIPIVANFVAESFNPANDAFLLFDVNGSWQRVEKILFVPAKRSALRLTKSEESK